MSPGGQTDGRALLVLFPALGGNMADWGKVRRGSTLRAPYQLAQVTVARVRPPLESRVFADFVAALDPVNASADQAPGYVWRLQTDQGRAT